MPKPWRVRREEVLDLSRAIVSDVSKLAAEEMSLTIAETINKPLLKEVFRGEAGTIGYSVINMLLTRFIDSFAFSTKLNSGQIDVLTVDALEHFSYESLEDVIIFLKMARTGKFGTTKKAVDSNLLFGEWFPMYLELKSREREKMIVEKTKLARGLGNYSEAVAKTYKIAAERKSLQDQKNEIDNRCKTMDRQMLEDLIFTWERIKHPLLNYLKTKRLTFK